MFALQSNRNHRAAKDGKLRQAYLINLCVSLRPWRLCGSDFAVKTGDLVDPQELT
jgi:hypothetical protein